MIQSLLGLETRERFIFGGIAALFIVGLILRLIYAYNLGLWNDEAFTVWVINQKTPDFISFFWTGQDIHPPFYYVVTKLVYDALPTHTDFSLKSLNLIYFVSAFFSIMYYFLKVPELRKPLFFSSLLITLSATHIYLSSELRSYGLLAFLTLLGLLYFSDLKLSDSRIKYLAGSLLLFLLPMTHYFGIFVALALVGSWGALHRFNKEILRASIKLLTIPTVLFALYLPIFLNQLAQGPPTRSLTSMIGYSKLMFNGYLPLLFFVPALILFGRLLMRQPDQSNASDRLLFLSFTSSIIVLFFSLIYYLMRSNSVVTFSTFIVLVVTSALILGTALSKTNLGLQSIFSIVFILLSMPAIVNGLIDPTFFESTRLPYRNIVSSIEDRGFILNGNSVALSDEPWDPNYSQFSRWIRLRGHAVEVIRLPYFDIEKKVQDIVRSAELNPERDIWLISRMHGMTGVEEGLNARGYAFERVVKGAVLIKRAKSD